MKWDLPDPFVRELEVVAEDIDELGHANNATYVRWMERCAWGHSQHLGLDLAAYRRLDRAMAVVRHEVDYLASAYQGECLCMGTWIVESDHRQVLGQVETVFDGRVDHASGHLIVRRKHPGA